VLVWHAQGEELAIFPMVEKVAPSVAEAYERDHRGLDAAFDALNAAVLQMTYWQGTRYSSIQVSILTYTWQRKTLICYR